MKCKRSKVTHSSTYALAASLLAIVLISACGSGGSSTSDEAQEPSAALFQLSTEWQGPDKPLGLVDADADNGKVALIERRDDSSDRWAITELENGFFRLNNLGAGDAVSLDIINDGVFDDVRLLATEAVTGQFWNIERLDNGFCRLTTSFLGSELSLDILNDDDDVQLVMAASRNVSGQHWRTANLSDAPASTSVPSCSGIPSGSMNGGTNPFELTSNYRLAEVEGFTLRVNPAVDDNLELREELLSEVRVQLTAMREVVNETDMAQLRSVGIWVEPNGGASAAVFHRSAQWLDDNGLNPDKAGGVELNASLFVSTSASEQPWILMHEFAHAREHGEPALLASIRSAYTNAVESGLYVSVARGDDSVGEAYALTNEYEYFAELTEAYFGRNDFFPFVRTELASHDPVGYRMVEAIWR